MRPLALVAAAFVACATVADAQSVDQKAVEATVHSYHDALARGDAAGAMRLLAPDALILESGGLETRADYEGHHLPGDIAFAKAVPSQRTGSTVVVAGDVAWVAGTSKTTGTYWERAINSAGAELMVLSRTADGWRIRAIHWSSRNIRTP